ncbi:MAG: hypothetical protein KF774_09905 [Planctomyces sp.]|nr:hypothetical protein [Planctomyces sp.]
MSDPPGGASFNLIRVVLTVSVLALLIGGAVYMYENRASSGPRLVEARGRVTWKGNPVTVGAVMTQHVDDPMQATLGAFDSDGKFVLDTNGDPGAAVGRHKLIVASYEDGGLPPPPRVPTKYVDFRTTPLEIEVFADPSRNVYEIVLEGELDPRPGRGGPPAGDDGPAARANGRPELDDSAAAEPAAQEAPADGEAAADDAPAGEAQALEDDPA